MHQENSKRVTAGLFTGRGSKMLMAYVLIIRYIFKRQVCDVLCNRSNTTKAMKAKQH